jgi:hypothetical protein
VACANRAKEQSNQSSHPKRRWHSFVAGGRSPRLGDELCDVVRRYDWLGDEKEVAITAC